jgi:hypothetical protein
MEITNRLRQARHATGEDLADLARRIGVRQEHLRAIEDGRLGDLPAGIYGRAAVRSFANALGFDGAGVLTECEPFLAPLDEPIAAMGRLRGIRVKPHESHDAVVRAHQVDDPSIDPAIPGWRPFAAAAVDACVIVGLLLVLIVAALTLLTAPIAALKDSGAAFALMGVLLAAGYFFCFGGVRGATVGERAFGVELPGHLRATVTLALVAERALLAATEDARCIYRCGEWLARSTASWMSDATGDAKG